MNSATNEIPRTGYATTIVLPLATQSLSLNHKRQILKRLWDLDLPNSNRLLKFNAFFEHYQVQIAEHGAGTGLAFTIRAYDDLFSIADVLKHHAHLTRAELRAVLERTTNGGLNTGAAALGENQCSYGTLTHPQEAEGLRKAIDSILATTVRVLFAINLNLSPGRILVGQSDLDWRENQSLAAFIQETFPVYDFADEPHTPIKSNKLRARHLETQADIRIEWTRHLPDHLKLDHGHRTKVLRIFELVSLLEMTYEALKEEPWQLSLSDSLKFGCYAPGFLYETLQTILLLFPTQDRQWLDGKINSKLRWHYLKGRGAKKVDKRLSVPFKCYHRETMYDRPLTTRRELFARYPHWAVRLHILYTEAEDPAPVSWFGRWAERRRAARHTFWLTFVAFMVAIMFGVVASILAAIQIWISYCQWKGQGASGVCG